MTITIATSDLVGAAKVANGLIPRRNTIPVLSYAHLEVTAPGRASLTSTDLDVHVTEALEIEGGEKGQQVLLSPARLLQIARVANGSIGLDIGENTLRVTSGPASATFNRLIPAVDFPNHPTRSTPHEIKVGEADLHRLLSSVLPFLSGDETRYYLSGVYLHSHEGKMRAVTTDGHRMAICDTDVDMPEWSGIVPRSTAKLLLAQTRAGGNRNVSIGLGELCIDAKIGERRISSKTIDGTYPDYHRVIPDHSEGELGVQFAVTPAMLAPFSTHCRRALTFDCEAGHVSQKSLDWDMTITMPCEGKGRVGFDPKYLREIVNTLGGTAQVTAMATDQPAVVRGDDAGLMYVLMPMRID